MTRLNRIAVLGNYLPRQCGIATFTTHLSESISSEFPLVNCFVLAMNDSDRRYAYPEMVRFEIEAANISSYHRAADFLNVGDVDLVSVQHEYGIFGGKAGSHVLAMLRELRMPIVTTLHTVLASPNRLQRLAMDEITQISERVVVMSEYGATLLQEVHGVSEERIDVIPHGIPNLPDAVRSKNKLGVEGKSVILTFGLLAPDKGIEGVIDALPAILAQYPHALYIILGVTHPHVKEKNGEAYRVMLENRAARLGVDSSVVFHNRFVSQAELNSFISAADIYITPYLNPEQITSGTLAYALGSGKAVISTPYAYARELLADGRGVLVPWPKDDHEGISNAVIGILGNENRRATYRKLGTAYGQKMRWPSVARAYMTSFEKALTSKARHLQTTFHVQTLADRPIGLPEVKLDHLTLLSDDTGILQHAAFSIPRYDDGYCLDDNARAFLLTSLIEEIGDINVKTTRVLASRYLAFMVHAFDNSSGRFRNVMSYSRQWLDSHGSEDSHGRALWALGSVIGHADAPGRRNLADTLFHSALPAISFFTSPRAWAYALLGMDEYLCIFGGDRDVELLYRENSLKLFDLYQRNSTPEWPWFEERATYCNARLSQALLLSGARMEHSAMIKAGVQSLEWLSEIQTSRQGEGCFAPIGSNGFYQKGGTSAAFDQQPVEVCAMISACLTATVVTGEGHWMTKAQNAFNWFLGQNRLQQPLYDASTGGCRDGLHADRPNENQGAESTLSFLMALCEMRAATLIRQPNIIESTGSQSTETNL
ncbi:MAG: glycosyltransferase family 4 protein [Deltaproteobacteria bacterium]|nr:glycosyltransferase family 4 protein [Deltaproteobacteria bacterium]